ncbi:hypothetical protein G443_001513 [Actinoalloteichus cyanogriseus DSM 43889]|uniref:Basic proline-rich protein n=1 Tax=Actinoalloteichus caeruleus DSM 43889 TaxID=1120930 RepID=A0ABT1JGE7_ACTCY|nr:hypothetical protein [Actinoalloteichus caeruleus DSM 43889]
MAAPPRARHGRPSTTGSPGSAPPTHVEHLRSGRDGLVPRAQEAASRRADAGSREIRRHGRRSARPSEQAPRGRRPSDSRSRSARASARRIRSSATRGPRAVPHRRSRPPHRDGMSPVAERSADSGRARRGARHRADPLAPGPPGAAHPGGGGMSFGLNDDHTRSRVRPPARGRSASSQHGGAGPRRNPFSPDGGPLGRAPPLEPPAPRPQGGRPPRPLDRDRANGPRGGLIPVRAPAPHPGHGEDHLEHRRPSARPGPPPGRARNPAGWSPAGCSAAPFAASERTGRDVRSRPVRS